MAMNPKKSSPDEVMTSGNGTPASILSKEIQHESSQRN